MKWILYADLTLKKILKLTLEFTFYEAIRKKISKSRKFLPNFSKFPFFSFFSVLIQKGKREEWWPKMISRLSSNLFSRRVTCFLIPKFRSGITRCLSLKKCLNKVLGIAQTCVLGQTTEILVKLSLYRDSAAYYFPEYACY